VAESQLDDDPTLRSPDPLEIGATFAGRYVIEAQLGSGGIFSLLQPDHPYSRRVAYLADLAIASASKLAPKG